MIQKHFFKRLKKKERKKKEKKRKEKKRKEKEKKKRGKNTWKEKNQEYIKEYGKNTDI